MRTEEDFAYTCRTCLNADPDQELISIFDNTECNDRFSFNLLDQLSLLNLKIAKDDAYPTHICNFCMERVEAIDAFRKQCGKAQEYFERYSVKPSQEIPEIKPTSVGAPGVPVDSNGVKRPNAVGNNDRPGVEREELATDHRLDSVSLASENEDTVCSGNPSKDPDELKCQLCDKIFRTVAIRNNHLLLHGDDNRFPCDECNLSFKCSRYLRKHKKTVHSIGEHVCPTCGKNFSSTSKYEYHLKTHEQEKKYKCHHCEKSFIQHTHRKNHELSHTTKRSYLCNVCGKSFRHECSLKTHLKKHDGLRKYACGICNRLFAQKGSLKLHLAVHNNVRAYQCEQCGKKFTQQGTLMKHLILHNAEKLHCCEFCDQSFLRIRDLRRHNLMAHGKTDISIRVERSLQENENKADEIPVEVDKPSDSPYCCDLCSRTFKVPSSLAKHIKVHSEERKFICTECGNTFKKPEHLKLHINGVHLKQKPYSCEVCKKPFARVGDRNVHMRTHSDEKSHQCSFCGRGFSLAKALRAHIRQHTGERPFVCIICNAGYTCHKSLASHTRKQHSEGSQVLKKLDELAQTVLHTPSTAVIDCET